MKFCGADTFRHPSSELEALFACSASHSFFLLPEWFSLIGSYGSEPGTQLVLAADEKLGVALPLLHGAKPRRIRSCTNLYTCEFDVLGHANEPEAVRALAKAYASASKIDYIRLDGISAASSSLEALCAGFREAGLVAKPFLAWGTWFEGTDGIGFEEYLERRPAILRNTWKRKAQLCRSAGCEIRLLQPGAEVAEFLAAYEAVHSASWKQPEPYPESLKEMVRLAAGKGALRMGLLTINRLPIAAQFWLVWNGRALIFKLAYDSRFSRFSPGTVLTMHLLRSVLEADRPWEISFGRGDDAYKKLWCSQRREYWGIEAANPRTAGGFLRAVRIRLAQRRGSPLGNARAAGPKTDDGG